MEERVPVTKNEVLDDIQHLLAKMTMLENKIQMQVNHSASDAYQKKLSYINLIGTKLTILENKVNESFSEANHQDGRHRVVQFKLSY